MEVCQRVGSVVETRLYGDQACPHLVVKGMFESVRVFYLVTHHTYRDKHINF